MTKNRPPGSNRRRPKRQRTATTLYTDDNPSTFTTKPKRGELLIEPEEKIKPTYFYVEVEEDGEPSSSPTKRPYRRRKPYNKHGEDFAMKAPRMVSNEDTIVKQLPSSSSSSPDPQATPVKRKRGRPPKKRPPPPPPAASPDPPQHPPPSPQRKPEQKPATTTPLETLGTTSWTPIVEDATGTFLSHAVTVAPILPPTTSYDMQSIQDRYSNVFGKGLGVTTPLEQPQWTPLYSPDVYFDDDYEDHLGRLDPSALPVTRSITCVTTRKPDHAYMAVGDSAGFCIVYSLGAHIRPVARLETVACQQRARPEQEKIREQQRRKKGKLRSLVMDTSQTTIHALGMIGSRVVLATTCELECMDVPSQTSLWVCPLSSDRLVTSLDMHMSTYDVLVSCSLYQNEGAALAPSSPLMLLQHSRNNVEVCDANAPILLKSPCCTAIWDASKSVENRLLFVALPDDQELELVLVQGGSIDNWKVACKTRIPVKSSNHQTKLTQSPEGIYTMVASSRGIRLYQTETLQLIHVYGDQLALHGKSVVWQDCLLLGNHNNDRRSLATTSRGRNIECDNWLQDTTEDAASKEDTKSDLGYYVVGVPHFKGPKELCETLHAWKVEAAGTVPAFSIPVPAKSDGVQGLVAAPSMGGSDRIILATRYGEGHCLLPKIETNFAGIMYPPGYRVITDNLEYIEDEDATDQVDREEDHEEEDVDVLTTAEIDGEMDEDLKEAMRQSLLEQISQQKLQSIKDKDKDVDILNPEAQNDMFIPCRPEPYLRQAIDIQVDEDEEVEPEKASTEQGRQAEGEVAPVVMTSGPMFTGNVLDCMPNAYKKAPVSEFGFTVTAKVVVASAAPAANRPGRGKRSRAANLESLLKASIDPQLQRFMISSQSTWADGMGSSMITRKPPNAEQKYIKPNGFNKLDSESMDVDEPAEKDSATEEAVMAAEQNPKQVTPSPTTSNEETAPEGTNGRHAVVCTSQALAESKERSVEAAVRDIMSNVATDKYNSKVGQYQYEKSRVEPVVEKYSLASSGISTGNGLKIGHFPVAVLGTNIRPDEAAVALGLLGLSPRNTSQVPEMPASSDGLTKAAVSSNPNLGGDAASYLSSSLSRANLSTPVLDGTSDSASSGNQPLNHVVYERSENSLAASSDRDTASENALSSVLGEQKPEIDMNCPACRGRQVIHSCGKRSLPIDYDEVAKAEKERKVKEEDEKKKARAEKRRMADARRREARKQKQKELEERRQREEEEQRIEKERLSREEELAYQPSSRQTEDPDHERRQMLHQAEDPDHERRQMIVASYASHVSTADRPWPTSQSIEINTVDYNRQAACAVPATHSPTTQWERSGVTETEYASSARPTEYSSYENVPAQAELKPRSASMSTTLASADALVALASFAGTKAAQPEIPANGAREQPQAQQPSGGSNSYAYRGTDPSNHYSTSTAHGFSSGVPTSSPESKRSIPSYAAIHRNVNGGSSAANSFVTYGGVAANDANANHSATAYVWPPRPETEQHSSSYAKQNPPVSDTYYTGEERRNWPPQS